MMTSKLFYLLPSLVLTSILAGCGSDPKTAPPPPPEMANSATSRDNSTMAPATTAMPSATSQPMVLEEITLTMEPIPSLDMLPPAQPDAPVQSTSGSDRQAVVQKAQRRLRSHYRDMRACYDKGFVKKCKARGNGVVSLHVDAYRRSDEAHRCRLDADRPRCVALRIERDRWHQVRPVRGKGDHDARTAPVLTGGVTLASRVPEIAVLLSIA